MAAAPAVTKFMVPRAPYTLVNRPALVQRLDAAARLPCALVAGSPGVGKTVLLSSWIAERHDLRVSWVSCDRWDRDENHLWTSIASALATSESGFASDALDLLREGPDTIEDVVASLINELASSQGPTWLVLDDLHVVPPSALGALATFVERLPPTPPSGAGQPGRSHAAPRAVAHPRSTRRDQGRRSPPRGERRRGTDGELRSRSLP